MKKYINTASLVKITVLVWMLFSTVVHAQTDLPDAPDDTAAAPIDGSIWVLALIGLFFVYYRLRTFSKQGSIRS
ncbi:hypothetical protein [Flavobacterium nackdongense]|uniref:Signal peptidase n=1 Tax=Flavobacterium nackdongense TaxID=2547394 RepID=A0A4P6YDL8_9FLAO|nr:hypothetical protein [Flavobacterium nackdongense]QBN20408.1 hypothetical protein E1750_16960 [Flavobacterium nackdongense]